MIWILAATLVLHPVLDAPGPLRLVATGVEDAQVAWTINGTLVATTGDGEAATVLVDAGTHEVRAEANASRWIALARPDPAAEGARAVDGWVARHGHEASPPDAVSAAEQAAAASARLRVWPPVVAGGVLAAVILLAPKQP